MNLRFQVDQALLFRKGIDTHDTIVTIEVDPATLDQATRDLIADRLVGINVMSRTRFEDNPYQFKNLQRRKSLMVLAEGLMIEDLVNAIRKENEHVFAKRAQKKTKKEGRNPQKEGD